MSVDYQTVHALHVSAKSQFAYRSDAVAYGKAEYWVSPPMIRQEISDNGLVLGDCDDFASLCVMLARAQDLPARFVLCLTEAGESHLVAEIDGWVLDNRQDDAMRRDDLPYAWMAISGFKSGDDWHVIEAERGSYA